MKTKLTDICPEKIVKASSPSEVIPLLHSSNTANLKRIVFDVRDPVLLRLLVCKEEKSKNRTDKCLYPEHKNNAATRRVCSDSNKRLAHIYFRHEQTNKAAHSYVIVFIEGIYLRETDELLDILKNTVDWLNIAKERPYFYIIRYGQPVPDVKIGQTREKLTEKMKEIYNGYLDDEDTCFILPVLYDSQSLMIEHIKRFSIKVS